MKIYDNFSLKEYNTFAIDVSCQRFVVLESEEDVFSAIDKNLFKTPFFIIGGGSNVLFTSDFRGNVIHPAFKGMSIVEDTDDFVRVAVAAGEVWDDFVRFAVEHHYYGIENLVSIPGNVGSCPVQNIGAYGVEVKDVIDEVHAIDLQSGEKLRLKNEACDFSYRNSVFKQELKGKVIITEVVFKLSKSERYALNYAAMKNYMAEHSVTVSLENVCEMVRAIRAAKLPDVHQYGSAGSFFKNPLVTNDVLEKIRQTEKDVTAYAVDDSTVKLSAAQLIERAGCKQWKDGPVAVFPTQPLVIVNRGGATGKEVVAFYQRVQQAVRDKFGVLLEPEVNVL